MHDAHDAPRGQKTPPPGMRPGSLLDPGPQRSDRTVRHSVGDAPFLVVPALRSDDGVDGTTFRFLLEQSLSLKKKQEEEKERKRLERRQVLLEEFFALADVPVRRRSHQQVSRLEALAEALDDDSAALSSQPIRRKRKNKRKRKLPRNSSHPRVAAQHLGRLDRRTFLPRHSDRFRCPRCTHLETWTFYVPLVSGSYLFGARQA